MKKLILSAFSIGLTLGAFAQQNLNLNNTGILDNSPRITTKNKTTLNKADRSEWYNPLEILADGKLVKDFEIEKIFEP
jgi:hypothetical protein